MEDRTIHLLKKKRSVLQSGRKENERALSDDVLFSSDVENDLASEIILVFRIRAEEIGHAGKAQALGEADNMFEALNSIAAINESVKTLSAVLLSLLPLYITAKVFPPKVKSEIGMLIRNTTEVVRLMAESCSVPSIRPTIIPSSIEEI